MSRRLLLSLFATLLSAATTWAGVAIDYWNFPDDNFRRWLLCQDYGADGELTDEEIAGIKMIDVSARRIQSLQGIAFFNALMVLDCNENQLTALDVSRNTALKLLYCDQNQLTTLNVSGCTGLQVLSCSINRLTRLDVSKNTALTSLSCYWNLLTTLDVSKNTKLESLACYENQLTALDVSKNTALSLLYCSYNQLAALDVTKNTVLTGLHCAGNRLTGLDLTKNTALADLDCYQNQLKDAMMDALVESLPSVESGGLYVIDDVNEQNVMTAEQVAAVKAKGWMPYYYATLYSWQPYAGGESADIRNITTDPSAKGEGRIYTLDGRRVAQPTKGVYIVNGKKVVVK